MTSKIVRVIKPEIDEVIDVVKDGAEIGEVVFSGVTPKAESLIKRN